MKTILVMVGFVGMVACGRAKVVNEVPVTHLAPDVTGIAADPPNPAPEVLDVVPDMAVAPDLATVAVDMTAPVVADMTVVPTVDMTPNPDLDPDCDGLHLGWYKHTPRGHAWGRVEMEGCE